MELEEAKELFKESIDEVKTPIDLFKKILEKAYEKGVEDGKSQKCFISTNAVKAKENDMEEYVISFPKNSDESPTTVCKLVRCKDCIYGEKCQSGAWQEAVQCKNTEVFLEPVCHSPNWYCAEGEK